MKTIIALSTMALFMTSCASMMNKPISEADKSTSHVLEMKMKKKEAFNKMSVYLAKQLGDSNSALKLKDEESGQIVGQMNISCNEVAADILGLVQSNVTYVVEINVKDNKMKTVVTAKNISSKYNKGYEDMPIYESHIKALKGCGDKLIGIIEAGLEKSKTEDNW